MKPEINPYVPKRVAKALAKSSGVNQCCTQPANLLPEEANDMHVTAKLRCRVCGRGHHYMRAEPLK